MKRLILAAMMILFATTANAQKDVTKFLGIPVDGTKAEMIQKLKAKGFKQSVTSDLEGIFNGFNVHIDIVTNNNKVSRIVIMDAVGQDASSIKSRFNNLCHQFSVNSNYMALEEFFIPENENIILGLINNKEYAATFFQRTDLSDSKTRDRLGQEASFILMQRYTEKEFNELSDENKQMLWEHICLEVIMKKCVWFCISEYLDGKFIICMYYDNGYNLSNGEDL